MTMTTTTPAGLDPAALARYVDHTLLKPEATAADVAALVAEARGWACTRCASRRRSCRWTSPRRRTSRSPSCAASRRASTTATIKAAEAALLGRRRAPTRSTW